MLRACDHALSGRGSRSGVEGVEDIIRGMGEASSKGATGATPEDADVLKKAEKIFGIAGGRVDRIHVAVRNACLARWGSAPLGGSVGAAMQRLGLSGPCSSFRSARWAALACARASGQRGEQEASQSEDQGENLVLRSDCGTLAAICG